MAPTSIRRRARWFCCCCRCRCVAEEWAAADNDEDNEDDEDEFGVDAKTTAIDVCADIVKLITSDAKLSLVAVLQGGQDADGCYSARASWVGPPTHFISYAWSYSFRMLIDIVELQEHERTYMAEILEEHSAQLNALLSGE